MFGSLGFTELFFIFVIALLIFGPRKLPELGKTIGSALGQFKRASEDFKRTWEEEVDLEKRRPIEPKPAANTLARSADPEILDADPSSARAAADRLSHASMPTVKEVEAPADEPAAPPVA